MLGRAAVHVVLKPIDIQHGHMPLVIGLLWPCPGPGPVRMALQEDIKQARQELHRQGRRKLLCEVLDLRADLLPPSAVLVLILHTVPALQAAVSQETSMTQGLLGTLEGSALVTRALRPVAHQTAEGAYNAWPQLLHFLVGDLPGVDEAMLPFARRAFLNKVCFCTYASCTFRTS